MVAVREALNLSSASQETRRVQSSKIFVQGFSTETSEDEIYQLFSKHGVVDRVLYSVSPKTQQFRGFCYVVMRHVSDYNQLVTLGHLAFRELKLTLTPAQS